MYTWIINFKAENITFNLWIINRFSIKWKSCQAENVFLTIPSFKSPDGRRGKNLIKIERQDPYNQNHAQWTYHFQWPHVEHQINLTQELLNIFFFKV